MEADSFLGMAAAAAGEEFRYAMWRFHYWCMFIISIKGERRGVVKNTGTGLGSVLGFLFGMMMMFLLHEHKLNVLLTAVVKEQVVARSNQIFVRQSTKQYNKQ
eukprot:scaffold2098_cov270-Chaetoceros_neogracile.AAC.13